MRITDSSVLSENEALGADVLYTPDGSAVVCCGGTIDAPGRIGVWGVPSGEKRALIESERRDKNTSLCVSALAVSPDSSVLAFAHRSTDSVQLWELATPRLIRQLALFSKPTSWNQAGLLTADTQIATLCFAESGNLLAAGCWDCTAKVWNLRDDPAGRSLLTHGDNIDFVAFCADETKLITGTTSCIYVWDLASGAMIRKIPLGDNVGWFHVAVGSSAQFISVSWKGEVRVWNADWSYSSSYVKTAGAITSLAYSERDELLAIGLEKDAIIFWRHGATVGKVKLDSPMAVAFSPTKSSFVAAAPTKTVVEYRYAI